MLEQHMNKRKTANINYGKEFDSELGDYLLLNGAIMREKSYIEWLNFCMQHLESLN